MTIIIHHLHLSASERIIWLCEELSIPYQLEFYDREPISRLAPPSYKSLHPSRTSPVIEDTAHNLVIAETNACIEYIITIYGDGRLMKKPSDPGYAEFLFWWHYSQGSLGPAVTGSLFLMSTPDDNRLKQGALMRRQVAFQVLDQRLAKSKYLAGEEFTAADISSLFYFTTSRVFVATDLSEFPNLVRWIGEVGTREAYLRALEKGDPGLKPVIEAKPPKGVFDP